MIIQQSEDQKRASIISNLNMSMSVEAGAGAGKTWIVVERAVAQLRDGILRPGELVCITFTNAAAEEMRSRLMKRLREEAAGTGLSPEQAENLQRAIREQSRIQISTIHSFCFRLLKEQTFEARIPMDAEMLDEKGAAEQKERFFRQWFREHTKNGHLKPLYQEFYPESPLGYIHDTFMRYCDYSEETQFHVGTPQRTGLINYLTEMEKQADQMFAEIVRQAQTFWGSGIQSIPDIMQIVDPDGRCGLTSPYVKLYELYHPNGIKTSPFASGVYGQSDTKLIKEVVSAYGAVWKDDTTGVTPVKVPANCFKAVAKIGLSKNVIDPMNNGFRAGLRMSFLGAELDEYQSKLILDEILPAIKEYRSWCRLPENRHWISNNMLLQEALRLVNFSDEAREYFRGKFKCIYIDEFQDTDIVQRDLILQLCGDGKTPDSLRPGSLFFVGDPKQSIYAFRGADVAMYEDTRKRYTDQSVTDVEVYSLDRNHRSERPVIEWVNTMYRDTAGTGGVPSGRFAGVLSSPYSDMQHVKDNADAQDILRGVYRLENPVWIPDSEAKKRKVDSSEKIVGKPVEVAMAMDSRNLLEVIRQIVARKVYIYKKKPGAAALTKERVEYRDFLVLVAVKDDIRIYAEQLKRAGIPVNLNGAMKPEEEDMLVRFEALLRFLTWPFDFRALYGAMEVLMGGKLDDSNAEEANRRADLLYQRTRGLRAFTLLRYLASHPEYILREKETGEAVERAESRIRQVTEYLLSQPEGDRKAVFASLQEFKDSAPEKELSLENDPDAVRIMNFHKAKGLEGNIVIIAGRKGKKSKNQGYRFMNDVYPYAVCRNMFGETAIRGDSLIRTASGQSAAALSKQQEKAEWTRQEYVEVTRAREALIFMDALASGCRFNDYPLDTTAKRLLEVPELSAMKLYAKTVPAPAAGTPTAYPLQSEEKGPAEEARGYTMQSISPSNMENHSKAWKPGKEAVFRPMGAIFGTVMHRAFELLVNELREEAAPGSGVNWDEETRGKKLGRIIRRAVLEHFDEILPSEKEAREEAALEEGAQEEAPAELTSEEKLILRYQSYLKEVLEHFLKEDQLIRQILEAEAVYTEMSFADYAQLPQLAAVNSGLAEVISSRAPLKEGKPYWISGDADLILVKKDGTVQIIDYKSDHLGKASKEELEAHLHDTYDNQQELYRYVVAKALGVDPDRVTYMYYHLYR